MTPVILVALPEVLVKAHVASFFPVCRSPMSETLHTGDNLACKEMHSWSVQLTWVEAQRTIRSQVQVRGELMLAWETVQQ